MATVGFQSAYAVSIISLSRRFRLIVYHRPILLRYNASTITRPIISAVSNARFDRQDVAHSFDIDQWFLVMSTQLIGFAIGGVAKRFLVSPPSMIWPANLVNCALFNTLHSQQYAGIGSRGGMSRERFFFITFLGAFIWCKNRIELALYRSLGCSCTFFPPRFLPWLHLSVLNQLRVVQS